jgi:hypothetical protein
MDFIKAWNFVRIIFRCGGYSTKFEGNVISVVIAVWLSYANNEVAKSSETLVPHRNITWRHNPEDCDLTNLYSTLEHTSPYLHTL